MDEPTTHLDIPSIDTLLNALAHYQGTFLFISHDVYFIRAIARKVLHIHSGVVTDYAGDYYLAKLNATDARAAVEAGLSDARPRQQAVSTATSPSPSAGQSGPKTREQRRKEAETRAAKSTEVRSLRAKVHSLEEEITILEAKQSETVAELEAADTYLQAGKPQALNRELSRVVDRLKSANHEWEAAAKRLADLEQA